MNVLQTHRELVINILQKWNNDLLYDEQKINIFEKMVKLLTLSYYSQHIDKNIYKDISHDSKMLIKNLVSYVYSYEYQNSNHDMHIDIFSKVIEHVDICKIEKAKKYMNNNTNLNKDVLFIIGEFMKYEI